MNSMYENLKNKVLMYDGTIKSREDIKIDDILMGDDSTPRKVTKLYKYHGKLYKISPKDTTESYIVSENYSLCLRYNTRPLIVKDNGKYPRYRIHCTESYLDNSYKYSLDKIKQRNLNFSFNKNTEAISFSKTQEKHLLLTLEYNEKFPHHEVQINEYLKQSKNFNHALVLYRTEVEYTQYDNQFLDPYFLGVWLGDGHSNSPIICNIDTELIDYLYMITDTMGLKIKKIKNSINYYISSGPYNDSNNPILTFLRDNKLLKNKHIPHNYLINTRKNRLSLLAGLIDTDGYYGITYYEIYQKNKRLANDIVFLARSLGYWCHIKEVEKGCMYKNEMRTGIYQKVTFGGDHLEDIPTLIPRKIAEARTTRRQKEALHHKFTITEDIENDYHDFEVSGNNHRYLMADFTVTHDLCEKL